MWDFGRHDFIKSGIHHFETFFLKSLQARLMKMSSLLVLINGTNNKVKIEGKADRTAKGYKYICPIFSTRQNVSLHQGLEKLHHR